MEHAGARVSIIFKRQRLYSCSALWPHLVSMRLEYRILIYLLIKWYCGGILERWRIVTSLSQLIAFG